MQKRTLGNSGLEVSALFLTGTIDERAVDLTADDLRDVESAASRIMVQGDRYSEYS